MPRRSNDFQKLIAAIYQQLVDSGATVRESVLLKERGSEIDREIDILIEQVVADIPVRIAVECRDHARIDDVTWIDGLIGKYRDLQIDKLIAVSRSGFSRGATQKATACGIELRTLSEALDSDWPSEFGESPSVFRINRLAVGCAIRTDPTWTSSASPTHVSLQNERVTFREFMDRMSPLLIASTLNGDRLRAVRELVDTGRGRLYVEYVVKVQLARLWSLTGTAHWLEHIRFFTVTRRTEVDVRVQRRLFGRIGVESSELPPASTGIGPPFRFTTIQAPGRARGPVSVERLPYTISTIPLRDLLSVTAERTAVIDDSIATVTLMLEKAEGRSKRGENCFFVAIDNKWQSLSEARGTFERLGL